MKFDYLKNMKKGKKNRGEIPVSLFIFFFFSNKKFLKINVRQAYLLYDLKRVAGLTELF